MESIVLYKSPYPKQRIGRQCDGGYVTIELPEEYDVFLSGGIADDVSFEIDFLSKQPNLMCYAFDGTINSLPEYHNRIVFVKKNLSNIANDELDNLEEFMEEYKNIFMKIDIEGHEFTLMPSLIEKGYMSNIKQLVIEIHSAGDIQMHPNYYSGLSHVTNNLMFTMLENINKTHTLVHLHANNACKMQQVDGINLPHVFELTYIRNDYVDVKIKNEEPLPTIYDIPNYKHIPEYQLSGFPYSSDRKNTL